jgi:radical SAM protein with 4Fe4S-binding SPASM domain
MQVEITNYCGLACPVCPTGNGELHRAPKAIDVELFERLMEDVGHSLLTLTMWAWGEPLLHKQLDEILAITRRYPFASLLSTNGQNLDDPRIQKALREHPPTYLIAAMDGLCDETNSVFRAGARLKPLLDGVRALADWKARTGSPRPILHCRFMAMKHNEHEIPRLRQFAFDAGFDMVTVRSLLIIDCDEAVQRAMMPDSDSLRAYGYRESGRVRREDFICQHPTSFPSVFADGTVVSCEQDFNASQPYGSMASGARFKDIWNSRQADRVRDVILHDRDQFTFCRNCPYEGRPISSCSLYGYPLRPFQP